MKYLIWDFNGTIVDDVDICIEAENLTIKKYLNREPITREEYLKIFTFPVKTYYERVGFTWEEHSYEEIGDFWFKEYQAREEKAPLHEGVKELLIEAKNKGIKNIIFSASREDQLKKQLKNLGVYDYFDEIYGASDIYAYGKANKAASFMKDKNPKDCLYLGDSLHDLDTAKAMGVECVLIANGHQAKEVLLVETNNVVDSIKEVKL